MEDHPVRSDQRGNEGIGERVRLPISLCVMTLGAKSRVRALGMAVGHVR
jgi:hypothetical protein